jgi:hypothetical protein
MCVINLAICHHDESTLIKAILLDDENFMAACEDFDHDSMSICHEFQIHHHGFNNDTPCSDPIPTKCRGVCPKCSLVIQSHGWSGKTYEEVLGLEGLEEDIEDQDQRGEIQPDTVRSDVEIENEDDDGESTGSDAVICMTRKRRIDLLDEDNKGHNNEESVRNDPVTYPTKRRRIDLQEGDDHDRTSNDDSPLQELQALQTQIQRLEATIALCNYQLEHHNSLIDKVKALHNENIDLKISLSAEKGIRRDREIRLQIEKEDNRALRARKCTVS